MNDFELAKGGELSVIVYDLKNERELVSLNKDHLYFSASLYKLYLGFLAYQDIDQGLLESNQRLVKHNQYGDLNLNTCLKLMIQISDSLCGEAVLAIYDRPLTQKRLEELGLPNINMPSFLVSAQDMSQILRLIYQGGDLSSSSRKQLFAALAEQTYSQILRLTFSDISTVYNKAGFSKENWHDVGILEFEDYDHPLAIIILSENVPLQNLQELTQKIKQTLAIEYRTLKHSSLQALVLIEQK